MKNNKITTLLFDLDGTLIDTNDLIISSFLHTLDHYYPNQYVRADVLPFIGPTLTESFESVDPERAQEMIDMYRIYNYGQHDLLVKQFDGVFETIQSLHQQGYKLGIVSTKVRVGVLKGIELTNLAQFFDVIISIDEVEHAKPDPEPVEKALHLLEAKPEEAIMIGDNYHDILAGKNAGTMTAGVEWTAKGADYLAQFKPDYMLKKMPDLLDILGVGKDETDN